MIRLMNAIAQHVVFVGAALCLLGCASTPPTVRPGAEAQLIEWLANGGGNTNLVTSLNQLPIQVRKYYADIADRGQKFNATCWPEPGVPSARFIAAGRNTNTLHVATERGGFACRSQFDAFVMDQDNKIVSVRADVSELVSASR